MVYMGCIRPARRGAESIAGEVEVLLFRLWVTKKVYKTLQDYPAATTAASTNAHKEQPKGNETNGYNGGGRQPRNPLHLVDNGSCAVRYDIMGYQVELNCFGMCRCDIRGMDLRGCSTKHKTCEGDENKALNNEHDKRKRRGSVSEEDKTA